MSRHISYALIFLLFGTYFNVDWYFEANKKFKFIVLKSVATRTLQVVLILLFIIDKQDKELYALLFSLGVFLGFFIGFIFFLKDYITHHKTLPKTEFYMAPLILVFFMQNSTLLYTQIDKIFLAKTEYGQIGVATYAIPQKIAIYLNTVIYTLSYVALPSLATLFVTKKHQYWIEIKKISKLLLMFSLTLGALVIIYSQNILNYFGLSEIKLAHTVLFIFILRIPIITLESLMNNQILLLYNKEKILMRNYLIFGAMNVLFNLILFLALSPAVALLTTLLCEVFLLASLIQYIDQTLFQNFLKYIKPELITATLTIAVFGVIYLIHPSMSSLIKLVFTFVFLTILIYKVILYINSKTSQT